MYGVVMRSATDADWPAFDRVFVEVTDVTGRASEPVPDATNLLTCFADTAAAAEDPTLVPVDADGSRPGDPGGETTDTGSPTDGDGPTWTPICPTHPAYREGLLEMVADCAAVAPDVRLDEVGFPGAAFCRCDRCAERFDESDAAEWGAWRASVITDFVADAASRIPGRTTLSVHPDPYPGHLSERSGVDVNALAPHVDEFVVPLYDPTYATTYWLESIASGFADALADLDAEVAVELHAVDQAVDALVGAVEAVEEYADHVYFGYDASTATAAIRRTRALAGKGTTYRPG